MIIANIKGHGSGYCPNAVFCSCPGTKKLRASYPWTVEGRCITIGRSDVKSCSVCSKKVFPTEDTPATRSTSASTSMRPDGHPSPSCV